MKNELTIFEKIIAGDIPADKVYEDEYCISFKDIAPKAPIHLLVVPKKKIVRISHATPADQELLGHLLLTARTIAEQEGFAEEGFRVVINNGKNAGEEVPHLHLHILAGMKL